MSEEPESQCPAETSLERKITALNAIYTRYGIEGLKDQRIADVGLLLSSKELEFRDSAKGRDLGEQQKAANRQLELQIKDLTAYVKSQIVGLSLSDPRSFRQPERAQQHDAQRQFKAKGRDMDMDR